MACTGAHVIASTSHAIHISCVLMACTCHCVFICFGDGIYIGFYVGKGPGQLHRMCHDHCDCFPCALFFLICSSLAPFGWGRHVYTVKRSRCHRLQVQCWSHVYEMWQRDMRCETWDLGMSGTCLVNVNIHVCSIKGFCRLPSVQTLLVFWQSYYGTIVDVLTRSVSNFTSNQT